MTSERRKIIENSISLLISRLTQSITTFILVASIARILGPYNLGQYTLAFTYYILFMTLTSQGFKTLFTRELSCNPQQTPVYLVNGTLLQFVFSIIGYVAMVLLVFTLPYNADTSIVCYILGLMIIPFSVSNVTEAIFQAQEKMYLIAISTVPVYILRTIIMIWAMKLKYGINFVCAGLVISEALILFFEWGLILQFINPQWRIDWNFIWQTFKFSRTFLAIEGIAILKGRMLVIILSLLSSEVIVGLYGSVVQLMQPFEIIASSLVVAVFPSMSKAVTLGKEKQRFIAESVIEILQGVGLPLIVGLLFIGGDILTLIYGDPKFVEGAVPLNIIALGLVAASFTRPLGYLLVANGFERVNLIEVTSTSVLTGLVGILLISKYQLMGAAITVLIIEIATSAQYIYAVFNRLFTLHIWRLLVRPLIISIFIVFIFLILKLMNANIITEMLSATLAYTFFVTIMATYAVGGPKVVLAKVLPNR
ncbi:MAG: flippase [Mojavia pulchra JT2-VF2]|jgi:O-antigen/teichoic acid export membrane protein|uniref:Flippase n=1 Tax=Mojavia pulchra JT2-VF2 TaxID=287848 RepID=A0A951PXP0_9NOST|nr:flippase [Mojavia pulchra JT2-VF2]